MKSKVLLKGKKNNVTKNVLATVAAIGLTAGAGSALAGDHSHAKCAAEKVAPCAAAHAEGVPCTPCVPCAANNPCVPCVPCNPCAVEKVGEAVEDAAEATGEAVEDAVEAVKEAGDKATANPCAANNPCVPCVPCNPCAAK